MECDKLKKFILSLVLVVLLVSSARATIPVARTDSIFEQLFLARYTEMQTWLENVAFSITNPRTLGDLIALPDKLKSLNRSLDRLTDFGNISGDLTRTILRSGNEALGDLGDYVRMEDIVNGNFDRVLSRIERAVKNIPIDTSGETEETKELARSAAASSAKAAMEVANTVPMSLPSVESAVATEIISQSPSVAARKQNVISSASSAKSRLMEEYSSYIAKYSGEDAMHKKKVGKILSETQNIVESSKEYAKNIGKMEAQQAIARVGADQIAMLAMQNVLLANINDTLADEIVLLSKIGLAGTEEYANAIKKSLEDYIDVYSTVRGE